MQERRRSIRWKVPFLSFIVRSHDLKEFTCPGNDISYLGMKVSSPVDFEFEEILEITLSLPQRKPIKVLGRKVWSKVQRSHFDTGVEFRRIQDTDKEEIFEYVMSVDPQQVVSVWWKPGS